MNKIVFKFLVANSGYIIDKSTIKEILDNVDERKKFSIKDYFKLINEIKGYSKTRIILMQILKLLWTILIIGTAVFSLYTIGNIIYQVIKTNDVTFFISTYTALVILISALLLSILIKTFLSGTNSIKSHIVTFLVIIGLLLLQIFVPAYQGNKMQSNYYDVTLNNFSLWGNDVYKPVMIHGTQKLTIHFDDGAFTKGLHFSTDVVEPSQLQAPVTNISQLYKLESGFKNLNDQIDSRYVDNGFNEMDNNYYKISSDEFNQTNYPTIETTTDIGINAGEQTDPTLLYIYINEQNHNDLLGADFDNPNVTVVTCNTKSNDDICMYVLNTDDVNNIFILLKKQ